MSRGHAAGKTLAARPPGGMTGELMCYCSDFDVYRAVGGGEKMRKTALRRASWFLFMDIMGGLVHMLRRDGKLWQPRLWLDGWRFLFGREGILRRIWPAYKDYFREGFHPWQRDTRALLAHWQANDSEALIAS